MKNSPDKLKDPRDWSYVCGQLDILNSFLSQSTPLIPEIEKAFKAGDNYRYWENNGSRSIPSDILEQEDYISNLKLDI